MKTNIKQISQAQKEIEIVIAAKDAMNDYKDVLKQLRPYAQVPGFRKGKAPLGKIDLMYGSHAKEEFIKEYIPKYFQEAISETKEKVIGNSPELLDHSWEKNEDFIVKFKIDVEPVVEFKNAKDFEVQFKPLEVNDEMLENKLNEIQDENSETNDSDKPVEEKNIVKVNIEHMSSDVLDEEKFLEREITVGSNHFGEDFDKNIIGKNIDETFETEIFSEKNKRKVKITVKKIQEKILPELTDEFAKEMDYSSLKEMKAEIKKELEVQIEKDNDRASEQAIIQGLIDANPIEVSDSIVTEQAKNMAEQQFKMYGKNAEGINLDQFIPTFKPMAEQQVKQYFLMNQLIEKEGIEITEDDRKEAIKEAADSMKISIDEYKEKYKKIIESDDFKAQLKNKKIIDSLKKTVKFVTPKEKTETKSEEDGDK